MQPRNIPEGYSILFRLLEMDCPHLLKVITGESTFKLRFTFWLGLDPTVSAKTLSLLSGRIFTGQVDIPRHSLLYRTITLVREFYRKKEFWHRLLHRPWHYCVDPPLMTYNYQNAPSLTNNALIFYGAAPHQPLVPGPRRAIHHLDFAMMHEENCRVFGDEIPYAHNCTCTPYPLSHAEFNTTTLLQKFRLFAQ